MGESVPNPRNFCGGNFQDWLEVMLTPSCNGHCSWCVEKNGWHPKHHASTMDIVNTACATGKANVILLGGEPTLREDLSTIVSALSRRGRRVWVTTNGGKLSPSYVRSHLTGVAGVNISIHDYSMERNRDITGIRIEGLSASVAALREQGAAVRFNCNCIAGNIGTSDEMHKYICWAKSTGAGSVRFAELKDDRGGFVDLAKTWEYAYGLNGDPFAKGCNQDAVIAGLPVNFRQMCGLQTPMRPKPVNPRQHLKQVLYYDGKVYDGWQLKRRDHVMTDKELAKLLRSVENGDVTSEEAYAAIKGTPQDDGLTEERVRKIAREERGGASSSGCSY